jgi:ketosteroid isomerase-like protein
MVRDSHTVDEADAILAVERGALDRWGKGDPSGFLEACAPDVVYFDNTLARRLDGLVALTALYEKLRGRIHLDRWEWLNPKVQVWGDAAVLTYNFVGYALGDESRWNCTEVYRRADGGWRIIQTHWSITQHSP